MNTKTKNLVGSLVLSVAACHVPAASAISMLSDEDMGSVSGRDGITLGLRNTAAISATQLTWKDTNSTGSTLAEKQLQIRDLSLTGMDFMLGFDVGSESVSGLLPSVKVSALLKPFMLQAGGFCPASLGSTSACASSFGEMALRTTADTRIEYSNTRGFLDGTGGTSPGSARFTLDLANAEFYMAQSLNSRRNLIALRNLYLRGSMTGSLSAEATGLRIKGDLNLPRVGSVSGLNMDFAVNPNIASGFTTAGSSSLLHLGASGQMTNMNMLLRAGRSDDVITGALASDGGLMMSGSAELKSGTPSENGFELEIGEGDAASGHAVRFTNVVSFMNGSSASPGNGMVNLGGLYLNVLPALARMSDFRSGFGALDNQSSDALSIAVRDLDLQLYPRNVILYRYADGSSVSMNPSGTLMLPVHDLDANLILMPGGHVSLPAASRRGIGFNLKAAVTGTNAAPGGSGDRITGLLLADTSTGRGRYIGIRNLNGYVTWDQGQFYALDPVTDNGAVGLRMSSAGNVQINLDGQFALDSLPDGSAAQRIKTTGHLFGLSVQLQSAGTTLSIMPAPAGQSYIALTGSLNLVPGTNSGITAGVPSCSGRANGNGSCLAIVEPVDGSQIQLASISGRINLTDSRIDMNRETAPSSGLGGVMERGYISFSNTIQFDPAQTAAGVFRIGDVNFLGGGTPSSPVPTGSYRLGEVIIPGGELYTRFDLRQR